MNEPPQYPYKYKILYWDNEGKEVDSEVYDFEAYDDDDALDLAFEFANGTIDGKKNAKSYSTLRCRGAMWGYSYGSTVV